MIVRWNLTGRRNRYLGQHTLVLSIGKSGRTWLRVLLNKLLSLRYNIPFELCDLSKRGAAAPSVVYEHELWKHFSEATIMERIKGKYLVNGTILELGREDMQQRLARFVAVQKAGGISIGLAAASGQHGRMDGNSIRRQKTEDEIKYVDLRYRNGSAVRQGGRG